MDLRRLWIRRFKGVDTALDIAPVTVLFGRNGTGKTNILEALYGLLAQSYEWRRDPTIADEGELGPLYEVDLSFDAGDPLALRILGLMGPEEDTAAHPGYPFVHFPVPRVGRQSDEDPLSGSTPDVRVAADNWRSELLEQFKRWVLKGCREPDRVADDVTLVAQRRLASNTFVYAFHEIWWLPPAASDFSHDEIGACKRLLEASDLWGEGSVPLLHDLLGNLSRGAATSIEGRAPILPEDDWYLSEYRREEPFRLVDPVWITPTRESLDSIVERIESHVEEIVGGDWVEEGEDGWARVWDGVDQLCRQIAAEASRTAPPFLRREYEILVRAIPTGSWHRAEGRRIQIALASISTGSAYDARTADRGLGLWAAYAVEEAFHRATTPDEARPIRAYLVDEPEAHLHPDAQRDIASWIADYLSLESTVILATHALPFLNIPREDVAYHHVMRNNDVTFTERVDRDVLGRLRERSEDVGVPVAEIIQLTRAFLIVEGKHDMIVLDHFFGEDLRASRIEMLPLRGTHNHLALVELEYLARHQIPLIAMFDNVTRAFLDEDADLDPESSEEAAVAAVRQFGGEIGFVALELPDILCALPDEVVTRTLDEYWAAASRFLSWDELVRGWKAENPRPNLKRHFARTILGETQSSYRREVANFLRRALHVARRDGFSQPDASLVRAVKNLVALVQAKG